MTEHEDFASLFGEYEKQQKKVRQPKIGDQVQGRVVSIQGDSVFVDLGGKTEGIIEREELTDADGGLSVQIGERISSVVSGKDEATGTLLLGSRHAKRMHGSEALQQAYEAQSPVEGHITGTTKGGLEVEMAGTRAFCPASQIDLGYVDDLQSFVGQRLAFRITKYEMGRHANLVVSRRVLLEEEQRALAAQTRARLEVGAVLQGKVTSLQNYGAFIDLGGIEGLVHVSELAFGRIEHPKELLSVGQEVEVSVLRIEKTDNPRHPEKISLSIRALEKDPWSEVETNFPVGRQVSGTVSRLQPFGAFIELVPGVEGLAHISELVTGRRISHPQEVLKVGDRVQVKVLSIDPEKRRIGLSLKIEEPGQTPEAADTTPPVEAYAKPKQGFGTLGDLLKESMKKQKDH
ncbi:MAG: 30S ribosomal protein S1 [Chromatiales bacterium]|jgi:small subunit ribosomal protein S1